MSVNVVPSSVARTGALPVRGFLGEVTVGGRVTLEISKAVPRPATICATAGIAPLRFFRGDDAPDLTLENKMGKYRAQTA